MALYIIQDNKKTLFTPSYLRKLITKTNAISSSTDPLDGSNKMLHKMRFSNKTYTSADIADFLDKNIGYDDELAGMLFLDYPYFITLTYLLLQSEISKEDVIHFLRASSVSAREEMLLGWLNLETNDILYSFFNHISITASQSNSNLYRTDSEINEIISDFNSVATDLNNDRLVKRLVTVSSARAWLKRFNKIKWLTIANKSELYNDHTIECDNFNAICGDIPAFTRINWKYTKTITEQLTPNYVYDESSSKTTISDISSSTDLIGTSTTISLAQIKTINRYKTTTSITYGKEIKKINTHYEEVYNEYVKNQDSYLKNKIKSIELNDEDNTLTYVYFDDFDYKTADLIKYYILKYAMINGNNTFTMRDFIDKNSKITTNALMDLYSLIFADKLFTAKENREFYICGKLYNNIDYLTTYKLALNDQLENEFFEYKPSELASTEFSSIPEEYFKFDIPEISDNNYYDPENGSLFVKSKLTEMIKSIDSLITIAIESINKEVLKVNSSSITAPKISINNEFIKQLLKIDVAIDQDANKEYFISSFGNNSYVSAFKNKIYSILNIEKYITYKIADFDDSNVRKDSFNFLFRENTLDPIFKNCLNVRDKFMMILLMDAFINYGEYVFNDNIEYELDHKYYISKNVYDLYKRIIIFRESIVDISKSAKILISDSSSLPNLAIQQCAFEYTPSHVEVERVTWTDISFKFSNETLEKRNYLYNAIHDRIDYTVSKSTNYISKLINTMTSSSSNRINRLL